MAKRGGRAHAAAAGAIGAVLAVLLSACGEIAKLPVTAGIGPTPTLPPPVTPLIPTVHIAPAIGWASGALPQAAPGTQVAAFARDLDHPRWLLVLPNGDVLVAETNAPPKPDDGHGLKGWLMGLFMQRAGAAAPSANRITLLRDTDGDGVADLRTVLLDGLHSPFGMALVGSNLYVANSDAVLRFAYTPGATHLQGAGRWMWPAAATACLLRACAIRWAWHGSHKRARSGPPLTNVMNWAVTWCPTT
jgi:glucose/arabinose dehydrogenase